ncbi:hypothetical protein ACS8E3_10965 [Psychrobacter sp. 2Y5]|uniref:hypothetical protein n=1 Tax=unclassified Psychrobacter TaxID=196806 RepID=UPI003F4668FD
MSTTSTPSKQTPGPKPARAVKPKKLIAPMQQRLLRTWLVWIAYRLLVLPIFISLFNPSNPDIVGGIAWHGLWLIPAFIITPSIVRGRSPYMLLVSSMLTLVYLGASGVVLFTRIYGSSWTEILVYGLDFALLLAINIWLFILLKRLPSMNKGEK